MEESEVNSMFNVLKAAESDLRAVFPEHDVSIEAMGEHSNYIGKCVFAGLGSVCMYPLSVAGAYVIRKNAAGVYRQILPKRVIRAVGSGLSDVQIERLTTWLNDVLPHDVKYPKDCYKFDNLPYDTAVPALTYIS